MGNYVLNPGLLVADSLVELPVAVPGDCLRKDGEAEGPRENILSGMRLHQHS